MRISDWSSDVCSSDLNALGLLFAAIFNPRLHHRVGPLKAYRIMNTAYFIVLAVLMIYLMSGHSNLIILSAGLFVTVSLLGFIMPTGSQLALMQQREYARSEEQTYELQTLRRITYD